MRRKSAADEKFRNYAFKRFDELRERRHEALRELRETERGISEIYPTVIALLGGDKAA